MNSDPQYCDRRSGFFSLLISSFYGHLIDRNNFGYVVMEYLPYPTLDAVLQKSGSISENEALAVFTQLVEATVHMHNQGVGHRDLKTDNILFDPVTKHSVIVDFGLSISLSNPMQTSSDYVGTPSNMAPELLCKQSYHPTQVDSWALGIILLEMLEGRHPFHSAQSETDILRLQTQTWDFSRYSPLVASILTGLLQTQSRRRWSVQQVQYVLKVGMTPGSQRIE